MAKIVAAKYSTYFVYGEFKLNQNNENFLNSRKEKVRIIGAYYHFNCIKIQ